MTPEVRRFADADELATKVAQSTLALLAELTHKQNVVNFVLTGGTVGILSLKKIAQQQSDAVDWSRVHIWWGDERFVEADSKDRNAVQAYDAWLSSCEIPRTNIHEFPSTSNDIDLDEAAIAFDAVVTPMPDFDLVLLGMGPDGHVASLFPGHEQNIPGVHIVAEHDSPKPPPQRLSFSYAMLQSAKRLWFTVAGADKTDAVADVMNGGSVLPAARVSGRDETVWFVDAAAASRI